METETNTITEAGQVLAVEDGKLTIRYDRKAACVNCKACMAGAEGKEMIMVATNNCDAIVGDYVQVTLPDHQFIKAVAILYGLPMMLMMVGFFMGSRFLPVGENQELIAFLMGIGLMICTYLIVHLIDKRKDHPLPKAVTIVERQEK